MAERLRVGVVGAGNISRRLHIPTWMAADDATLVAIADPSPTALDAAGSLAGIPMSDCHLSPAELIDRADIDAVDICTPPSYRSDLIIRAVAQGKHVFAEKPLATTPASATHAVEAAAAAGVTLAVGHNYLVLDEVRAARTAIESGEIGEVRTATLNYLGVEYVPGQAGDWRRDPAQSGGGVLMDMIHAIYLLEAFLGEQISRVSAFVDNTIPGSHVEDLALCRFETKSKAGLVNIGWGFGGGQIEIVGAKGRVSIRYRNGGTPPWAPLESVEVTTQCGTRTVLDAEPPRPAAYEEFPPILRTFPTLVADFIAAVRTGRQPLAAGTDGLRILEAAIGAYASAATGATVTLPLDRQSPAFLKGATGVPALTHASWSFLERLSLYGPLPRTDQSTNAAQ